MTRLQDLYSSQDQSPWLDNLRRDDVRGGALASMVAQGIRGVTSNPSIFQHAIKGTDAYDEQFRALIGAGMDVTAAYWELVITDITEALSILAPVHTESHGVDGYVSVEVAPNLAHDTDATVQAALGLHERINRPNLYVKIPGTAAGVPAIEEMIAQGHNINVTLLFSVSRYEAIIEAYITGLERFAANGGDVSKIAGVASFFVSRVDSEVDNRLDALGIPQASALKGKAALANARIAYELFNEKFSGDRWQRLSDLGARVQRPLWASTSTKNAAYPDTLYVDELIGPDTVNTIPNETISAFEDHGTVARTVDQNVAEAHAVVAELSELGIDLEAVAQTLEVEGVEKFVASFDDLISALNTKVTTLGVAG